MNEEIVPRLRALEYSEQINIRVKESTKRDFRKLKAVHNIDVAKHFRKLIEEEMARLVAIYEEAG